MNKDIHFYATYSAARLAGMPASDAIKLAYFCQTTAEFTQNPSYQAPWHTANNIITAPSSLLSSCTGFPYFGIASNYWDISHGYSSLFSKSANDCKHTSAQRSSNTSNTAYGQYQGAGATLHNRQKDSTQSNKTHKSYSANVNNPHSTQSTRKNQQTATKQQQEQQKEQHRNIHQHTDEQTVAHQQRAVKNLIRNANPLTSYFWAGQFDRKSSLRGFFGLPKQSPPPENTDKPSEFIDIDDAGNATYVSHDTTDHSPQKNSSQTRFHYSSSKGSASPAHHAFHEQQPETSERTYQAAQQQMFAPINAPDSRAHRDLLQHSIQHHGDSLAHLGVALFCYQNSWLHTATGQELTTEQRQKCDLFALFHSTKAVIEKYLAQQDIPLEGSFSHYFESLNQVAECLFYAGSEEQRCGHWRAFIVDNIDRESANNWQALALLYNPQCILTQLQQTACVNERQIIDEKAFWQSNFGQHLHALIDIDSWYQQLLKSAERYLA